MKTTNKVDAKVDSTECIRKTPQLGEVLVTRTFCFSHASDDHNMSSLCSRL